jgi:pimeloyl-ACP methyl ester carboxylesterase
MRRQNEIQEPARSSADDHGALMWAGIAVTPRRMSLAGISTAVFEGGNGPPVVLLHSSGEFAGLWSRVIPDLLATHRVVVPDLPGHGASGIPDSPLSPETVLRWLGELIEQTCPHPPVLVGHGLGGAIAARFAIDSSEWAGRLVLVDTLGLGPFEPSLSFGRALHHFLEQPTEETRDGLFRQCFADLDRLRGQLDKRWAPIAAYALECARTPGQQTALSMLMPHFGITAIPAADLARIGVATTLIWGRHDLQVPLATAETAATRFGWPLHVIDNAGDDPALEQPQAFLNALHMALATADRKGAEA